MLNMSRPSHALRTAITSPSRALDIMSGIMNGRIRISDSSATASTFPTHTGENPRQPQSAHLINALSGIRCYASTSQAPYANAKAWSLKELEKMLKVNELSPCKLTTNDFYNGLKTAEISCNSGFAGTSTTARLVSMLNDHFLDRAPADNLTGKETLNKCNEDIIRARLNNNRLYASNHFHLQHCDPGNFSHSERKELQKLIEKQIAYAEKKQATANKRQAATLKMREAMFRRHLVKFKDTTPCSATSSDGSNLPMFNSAGFSGLRTQAIDHIRAFIDSVKEGQLHDITEDELGNALEFAITSCSHFLDTPTTSMLVAALNTYYKNNGLTIPEELIQCNVVIIELAIEEEELNIHHHHQLSQCEPDDFDRKQLNSLLIQIYSVISASVDNGYGKSKLTQKWLKIQERFTAGLAQGTTETTDDE